MAPNLEEVIASLLEEGGATKTAAGLLLRITLELGLSLITALLLGLPTYYLAVGLFGVHPMGKYLLGWILTLTFLVYRTEIATTFGAS
ncbi:hypothetical protein [Halarchaeum nitratireducens]|uniref:Uncharacterized protein n=1 Tax=Halarchaeum nitratireducens TaxID=489913 RepID=A0A830G8C6_9EURY|nr:hypothetical protein [Halarchaeum nitratireducens]GGN08066.1 hypothetical protein GCM10009021_04230 [Halarchaeum nitratireducens]